MVVSAGSIFICIGRLSDTSFERYFNPHHFGKISFQILASTPFIGGLSNYSPQKSLYSQSKIQENMGFGDVPPHLVIFKNHEKANNNCTTNLKYKPISCCTSYYWSIKNRPFLYLKFGYTSYSFK